MALRVIGIDDGSKEQLVRDCGAEHFIDVTKYDDKSVAEEVVKVAGGLGASAVIVCAGSNKAYAQALDFLRYNGTVVCVGVPEGELQPIANSYPPGIIFKQATITGSAVGNRTDAIECLDFAARGIVKTHFRLEKMENLTDVSYSLSMIKDCGLLTDAYFQVFHEMKDGKLKGRVVIDLQ